MWSNTELSELQRVREKQHDAESTDEAVVELVVISCDFRAQTGQAIITVVDRVHHTTFREWVDDPTAS
jgi:hypothetical protein